MLAAAEMTEGTPRSFDPRIDCTGSVDRVLPLTSPSRKISNWLKSYGPTKCPTSTSLYSPCFRLCVPGVRNTDARSQVRLPSACRFALWHRRLSPDAYRCHAA